MRFGMIGLGRMGGNLSLQAIGKGHQVVGYSPSQSEAEPLVPKGLEPASSIEDLARRLSHPRIVFVYVPHGRPTDQVCDALQGALSGGDIVVDGGNSYWRESIRRHERFKGLGIDLLDCGTSGGIDGAREGACFMVGGEERSFRIAEPIFRDLAVPEGVFYAGSSGAGHFAKLIHNAIEFGMLQAIGEGVALLEASEYRFDLPGLMRNWAHGSVIRSWLIELMEWGLRENKLDDLSAYVEDTREVRWAVEFALEKEVWIPVISQAELALYRSRDRENVSAKAVALLRHGFGGHPLHRKVQSS